MKIFVRKFFSNYHIGLGTSISLGVHAIALVILFNTVINNNSIKTENLKVSFVDLVTFEELSALPEIDKVQNELAVKENLQNSEKQIKKNKIVEKKVSHNLNLDNQQLNKVEQSTESNNNADFQGNSAKFQATGVGYNGAERVGEASASYENIILSKLERVKRYPDRALERGLEGEVLLELKISKSGDVIVSDIKQSSGYDFFDSEVLKMVKRAAPFPALPNSINFDVLEYIVPINFQLS